MKKYTLLILLALFCYQAPSLAQNLSCITKTKNVSSNNENQRAVSTTELHSYHNESGNVCVKVYIHKVSRNISSNHSDYISDAMIAGQVNSLNGYFSGSGITFEQQGDIIHHNYEDINHPENIIFDDGSCGTTDFSELDDKHADGIDLYFFDVNFGASAANGIANETEAVIQRSHVIDNVGVAHEVGHILGLFHTYHSTYGDPCENDDSFNHVSECTGSGGDYVNDTPADNFQDYTYFNSNCMANAANEGGNCGGNDWEDIDLSNIMSIRPTINNETSIDCANTFSNGQIRRMKYFLKEHFETLSCDYEAPIEECTNCGDIEVSPEDLLNSMQAANSLPPPFGDGSCSYTMSYPSNLSCTGVRYKILWNGVDGINQSSWLTSTNSSVSNPYTNGDHTIRIEAYINNGTTLCDQYTCDIEITQCEDPAFLCNEEPSCDHCPLEPTFNVENIQIANCEWEFSADPNTDCPGEDYQYFWYINGALVSTQQSFTDILSNESGAIFVECFLRYESQCKAYYRQTIACGKRAIKLSPNPVKPNSQLQIDGIDYKDIEHIEVYDLFGSSKMSIKPTNKSFVLPKLQSGIYIVKFHTKNGVEQKKIIIE